MIEDVTCTVLVRVPVIVAVVSYDPVLNPVLVEPELVLVVLLVEEVLPVTGLSVWLVDVVLVEDGQSHVARDGVTVT